MPISAILFGGRRATAVPLVTESFTWQHGVFLGANIASEKTAAAEGTVGELRRDPFAMLPFCGYNMGDYFAHWLKVGAQADAAKLPKIYYVNWFRKNAEGKFVWPGYGENSRVLKWIVERLEGTGEGVETPIGVLPTVEGFDLGDLKLTKEDLDLLFTVDADIWRQEAALVPPTWSCSATTPRRSCGTSTGTWSRVSAEPEPQASERPARGTNRAPAERQDGRSSAGRSFPDQGDRQGRDSGRSAFPAHRRTGPPAHRSGPVRAGRSRSGSRRSGSPRR